MNVRLGVMISVGVYALVCLAAVASSSSAAPFASPQDAGAMRLASAGVYSVEQATRGQSLYSAECSRCHGETLSGSEFGPPLIGADFSSDFDGQTVADLFTRIQTTMPQDSPGRLDLRQTADIVAHLLKSNDFPSGPTALEDGSALKNIKIDMKK